MGCVYFGIIPSICLQFNSQKINSRFCNSGHRTGRQIWPLADVAIESDLLRHVWSSGTENFFFYMSILPLVLVLLWCSSNPVLVVDCSRSSDPPPAVFPRSVRAECSQARPCCRGAPAHPLSTCSSRCQFPQWTCLDRIKSSCLFSCFDLVLRNLIIHLLLVWSRMRTSTAAQHTAHLYFRSRWWCWTNEALGCC